MSQIWKRSVGVVALSCLYAVAAGCGPSQADLDAKQHEIDRLNAEVTSARAKIGEDEKSFADAQKQIQDLQDKLTAGSAASKEEANKLRQALAEYKQRADQLTVIEARFRELKQRLEKLTQVGLKVVVRKNRMVIQLPGDVLFDSGKDELKQGGKDVLQQVADVVRGDTTLNARNFQVAGHTDNVKYGTGPFHDNWGLSLARARTVVLFLVNPKGDAKDPKKASTGGGLDRKKWAAAGYAEFDPIAGTVESQTKEDMGKNRRVELVLQPNVEEMLDLNNIK